MAWVTTHGISMGSNLWTRLVLIKCCNLISFQALYAAGEAKWGTDESKWDDNWTLKIIIIISIDLILLRQ